MHEINTNRRMTLHIFNPEHDIALASNLSNFTAPHAGRQLRADLGFLPALWAEEGDVVLVENVEYFRGKMLDAGFDIKPTQSAICAVMLYDAKLSQDYANRMLEEGIYVTGFYYPVVPKGQARIRVQISAGHNREQLDKCIAAFIKVGRELGVLK